MSEYRQKAYATLVGRVDRCITDLVNIVLLESIEKDRVLKAAKDLQQALQEAEEMYMEAEDEEQSAAAPPTLSGEPEAMR